MIRAHEGRPMFAADEDRRFLLNRMRRVLGPGDTDLLAWAVLVNHVHLVLRVTETPPATLFRRLNTSVARRERRRRGEHGAVFQDRYWSRPCRGDGLDRLLTYVLGNPAHHGVVPTAAALETYEWTAYPAVLGLSDDGLVDPRRTLALLHPDVDLARASLREAMALRVAAWHAQRDGVDVCEEPGCRGEQDGCRLVHPATARGWACAGPGSLPPDASGPPAGIARVHDERLDRAARLRAAGWEPADLVAPLAAALGASVDGVRHGVRTHPECRARAAVIHVACDGVGRPVVELAGVLGVSPSSVSGARMRGRRVLAGLGWTVDDAIERSLHPHRAGA